MKNNSFTGLNESMTPEEKLAWEHVKQLQTDKSKIKTYLNKNLVTDAYIASFMLRKKITCDEKIEIPDSVKDLIYELYLAGVLPMRLGGITEN